MVVDALYTGKILYMRGEVFNPIISTLAYLE